MYECSLCLFVQDTSVKDYAEAGFWPGNPTRITYLFDINLLKFWFHLKNQSPVTSCNAFLEVLSSMSSVESIRVTMTINLFNNFFQTFDLAVVRCTLYVVRQLSDKRILNAGNTTCKACISESGKYKPLLCHCDGNFKLCRRLQKNQYWSYVN